ncbi:MAG TPA: DUF929 family protein [Mycobacteriales bacterium]|jgi:hypothetical protein|nr:DUF929 family protein [Mycobacteriales bacterium]
MTRETDTPPHGSGPGKQAITTRERAAAVRAGAQRSERRRRVLLSAGAIVVVIAVVLALVVVKLTTTTTANAPAAAAPAPAALAASLAAVPAGTFAQVGAGSANNPLTPMHGPALTEAGHPLVVYVGANYCPYCAAERWPLAVALSRFGTLSGLQTTTSAGNDVFPNTATLSFVTVKFTSSVLSFNAVEEQDREGNPLQTPTAQQQSLIGTYDVVPGQSGHPIPFVDFGNVFRLSGAQYDPGLLKGLSAAQIVGLLGDPGSQVAQAVDGSANIITAGLCALTGNAPADVCASAGVRAGASKLTGAGSGAGSSSH